MTQDDQGSLLPGLLPEMRAAVRDAKETGAKRAAAKKEPVPLAAEDPVAEVLVDIALAHLDRTFDYAVPLAMGESALARVRVKVRFAGQDVDGFVLARKPSSDHPRLQPLRRVVSAEQVLRPEIAELAAAVAHRYAGARSDVLRLAIPPRHARVEKEDVPAGAPAPPPLDATTSNASEAWRDHEHGPAFCTHLARRSGARAVWSAAPGTDWAELIAHTIATTYAAGRGVVACLPDGRDLDHLDAAVRALLGDGHHRVLRADAGPSVRYRDFLALARGQARIVLGTRSAIWAPVADLGLVVVWDDGDDLHAEPRAPYPHTREVAVLRAEQSGAAALFGAYARSVEAQTLVRDGWARPIAASRTTLRGRVRTSVAGATDHELARDPFARTTRFPTAARDLVRSGLAVGPRPRADPSRRICGRVSLRALPAPCPMCGLHRAAAPAECDRPTAMPVVRHGRDALAVPHLW